MMQPFSLRSYPRAIIHIDADSFFASCEQAVNPSLRGKPIITGRERGIASAVSIEAKKFGVKRGMSIREIQQVCPNIIHVPSDYETYSLYSKRMFEIVRRYTSLVEEYSIDECFAEISGLRRSLRLTYEGIAERIKKDLEVELGITFSIGLAPTKVVAKIASKWNKPSGLVAIPGTRLHYFLQKIPIQDVWGIGEQTTKYLENFRIRTALDFANMKQQWIEEKVTKPHREIWNELRGVSVLSLETEDHHDYKSISKTKTFTPPNSDRSYILAQLSKNTENACIKARRYNLAAKRFYFLLRTQDYRHFGFEVRLSRKTSSPNDIVKLIDLHLNKIYSAKEKYRLTGIVLTHLEESGSQQMDMFGESIQAEKVARVFECVDGIDKRYGKHTVYVGTSFKALNQKQYAGQRGDQPRRKGSLFKGEGVRKRLGIPMIGDVG